MTYCSEVPEIILLLLLVINLCVLSAKVHPHFINIVNLNERSDSQHDKGHDANPLQFLKHSLTEDVPVQAHTFLQIPEALILSLAKLFAVEQVDKECLLPSLKRKLGSSPIVVSHGEDEGKKVEQIEEGDKEQSIFKNIVAFLVLGLNEALFPLSASPQKSIPVLHQLLYLIAPADSPLYTYSETIKSPPCPPQASRDRSKRNY